MEWSREQRKHFYRLTAFAALLLWVVLNMGQVAAAAGSVFSVLSPLILGLALAFMLNIPMNWLETIVLPKFSFWKNLGFSRRRAMGFVSTILLLALTGFIIGQLLVPAFGQTARDLSMKMPGYWERFRQEVLPVLLAPEQLQLLEGIVGMPLEELEQQVLSFFQGNALEWLKSGFSFASSFFSGLLTFFLGLIFSIYILLQKETLTRQSTRLIRALLPEKVSAVILKVAVRSSEAFSHFLSGQLLEAAILGTIFVVVLLVLGFPYPLMIGVMVGITALVPIVGAFAGCVLAMLLILVVEPSRTLWFLLVFLIIQQVEGNLIYPHVVGKAAGLPSIWILAAVTIGGGLMGILGILLFIPLFSVAYSLLREAVHSRLDREEETQ